MIYFDKVRYKNFLSAGNMFIEINLSESPTTLIIGDNGSGKSMMLDALCYALFGKAFRKVNVPLLINSINEKDMVCEVEFRIGSKKYKICRGLKPRIFDIYVDDALLDQNSSIKDYQKFLEQNILKLNYKSFTQVVILGSSNFVPFMQLNPSDRRIIIEDLLDIKVFSAMNVLLRDKQNVLRENIKDIENHINLLNGKIEIHKKHLDNLTSKNIEAIKLDKKRITENNNIISTYSNDIIELQDKIQKKLDSITDKDIINNKQTKLSDFKSKIQQKIKRLNIDIEFFTNTNECPKCSQKLSNEFKGDILSDKKTKLSELIIGEDKILKELGGIDNRLSEINSTLVEIMEYESKIQEYNTKILIANNMISSISADILKKSCNDDDSEIKKEMAELETERLQYNTKKVDVNDDKIYYDVISNMLQDNGIKSKIIKQYLPIMNKLINMYLTHMDFFVSFELDGNFNESIKSRHRDAFTYNSFSEGQKARIDIALLLTWRKIARMKNSANTNLLILDEVFDGSLDSFGVDELTKLLQEDSDNDINNIFVISHQRDALINKFKRVIKYTLKNNFSSLEYCE